MTKMSVSYRGGDHFTFLVSTEEDGNIVRDVMLMCACGRWYRIYGLHWIGSYWMGLYCMGWDHMGLVRIGLDWIGLDWIGFDHIALDPIVPAYRIIL